MGVGHGDSSPPFTFRMPGTVSLPGTTPALPAADFYLANINSPRWNDVLQCAWTIGVSASSRRWKGPDRRRSASFALALVLMREHQVVTPECSRGSNQT